MFCLKISFLISRVDVFKNKNLFNTKKSKKIFIKNFYYNNIFTFQLYKKDVLFNYLVSGNNVYAFNIKINLILVNRFFKNLNFIFYNNHKILFIDSENDFTLPYYNYLYGYNEVKNSKEFFFIDKANFNRGNWMYFYKSFLIKKNISGLIVLNYHFYQKFAYAFSRLRVYLFSFFTSTQTNINVDYFFYISNKNYNFIKLIVYNNIINLFFKNYSINQYKIKKSYFEKFVNLKKII